MVRTSATASGSTRFSVLAASGWPALFPRSCRRTPYGISTEGKPSTDCTRGWLPAPDAPMRGSILRGYRNIVAHGYAAVYQDTRGRYAPKARIASMPMTPRTATTRWTGSRVSRGATGIGMSGSSAGATTTFAAAWTGHPNLRAFFAQVGGSSIYDDVVYEGNAIEMERLWLWVRKNIPGCRAHTVTPRCATWSRRRGHGDKAAAGANARYTRLEAACHGASAVSRERRLAAPAALALSGLCDVAALSRRDQRHPARPARCRGRWGPRVPPCRACRTPAAARRCRCGRAAWSSRCRRR